MSKLICDVCGTSYPETADHCPICGSARAGDTHPVTGNISSPDGSGASTYTYVKGGRFSKKNVRKRNRDVQSHTHHRVEVDKPKRKKSDNSNSGLIITIVVLLLAILAVCVYIYIKFFMPVIDKPNDSTLPPQTSDYTTPEVTDATELTIPCTNLNLTDSVVSLDKAGQAWLLNVTAVPLDTTDTVTYVSGNETVATVSDSGRITAVGPGETVITISCGEITVECKVSCVFETEPELSSVPEETTEPPTTQPQNPVDFKLNRSDITLTSKGDEWQLYSGSISKSDIVWTSDNEKIATISAGKVVAVGPGTTTVYGEYQGKKVGCIIRCSFAADPTTPTVDDNETYHLKYEDVTIKIGETLAIPLLNSAGKEVSAVYSANTTFFTISENQVIGAATGTANLTVTYNGKTYTCIVRVVR